MKPFTRQDRNEADALARELIAAYWHDFEFGSTWNYRFFPLRYHDGDAWATREQWLSVARRLVAANPMHLRALEVLLAEGCVEYLDDARRLLREWNGHDPEYYLDLASFLPADDRVRRDLLGYAHPRELDGPGTYDRMQREPLLRIGDDVLAAYLGAEIARVFAQPEIDEAAAEDYALPRLVELGPRAARHVDALALDRAKAWCLGQLEKDRQACVGDRPFDPDARRLWIRLDLAPAAWRLGWSDVLHHLRGAEWYWDALFCENWCDYEHDNLVTWPLADGRHDRLARRALEVMRHDPHHKLDGAIAWRRLQRGEGRRWSAA